MFGINTGVRLLWGLAYRREVLDTEVHLLMIYREPLINTALMSFHFLIIQVHERAANLGSGLVNLGCKPSQSTCIGIYGPNCIEVNKRNYLLFLILSLIENPITCNKNVNPICQFYLEITSSYVILRH